MSTLEPGVDEDTPQSIDAQPLALADHSPPPSTGGKLVFLLLGGAAGVVIGLGGAFLWSNLTQPAAVVQTVNPEAQALVSRCKPNIQACGGDIVIFNNGRPDWRVEGTPADRALLEWLATAPGQLFAIENVIEATETETPEFAQAYCRHYGRDCSEPAAVGTTAAPSTAVETTIPPT